MGVTRLKLVILGRSRQFLKNMCNQIEVTLNEVNKIVNQKVITSTREMVGRPI